ncbi:MAG: DeoR/GlpR family DNA-binding transcription regulator [Desulfovibrionaceae bacterium]|nr:DeoR/GlpR family DNA-binding transcription regulator [Desulfovibrionaceae bacterium]
MAKSAERRRKILEMIRREGFLSTDIFARHFQVTPQTIRKDLAELADQKLLERFHGGAAASSSTENLAYKLRRTVHLTEKQRIGALAASHIPNGVSLILNIGTTTEEVAKALLQHKDLTIITNNLNVARICAENDSFEVIVAGGNVRGRDQAVVGPTAMEFIRQFRVDFAVIGIAGIDGEGTLLDFDHREVQVTRAILQCARKVHLVCDKTKFGRPALVRVGALSDLSCLYTNGPLGRNWRNLVDSAGISLHLC